MEQTLVFGIQPSVRRAHGRPARIQTGGRVVSAFTGAFLGDRAKGSEGVALAPSWWPVASGIGCLAWVFSVVAFTVTERVPASSSGLLASALMWLGLRLLDLAHRCWCSGGILSGTRLWCFVCYPSDPS